LDAIQPRLGIVYEWMNLKTCACRKEIRGQEPLISLHLHLFRNEWNLKTCACSQGESAAMRPSSHFIFHLFTRMNEIENLCMFTRRIAVVHPLSRFLFQSLKNEQRRKLVHVHKENLRSCTLFLIFLHSFGNERSSKKSCACHKENHGRAPCSLAFNFTLILLPGRTSWETLGQISSRISSTSRPLSSGLGSWCLGNRFWYVKIFWLFEIFCFEFSESFQIRTITENKNTKMFQTQKFLEGKKKRGDLQASFSLLNSKIWEIWN
jgi:hypothetical protein